jgi:AcrR family transcriptional regulator
MRSPGTSPPRDTDRSEGGTRPVPGDGARLNGTERRESLLDTAAKIAVDRGVEAVTMESVSDEAGVSRALVYKHFANRSELLTAVYRREAALLHEEMASEVRSATSLEGMFRALVRASFRVSAERGALFAALRSAGAWNRDLRAEQRARDRSTVRAFANQAAREYSLSTREAQRTIAMLLASIDSLLLQWRTRRTAENAAALEETYLNLVKGGLERVAAASR